MRELGHGLGVYVCVCVWGGFKDKVREMGWRKGVNIRVRELGGSRRRGFQIKLSNFGGQTWGDQGEGT